MVIMQSKWIKYLLALTFVLSTVAVSVPAEAYYYYSNGTAHCRWVGGYWDRYGYWHPAHKVCGGGYYYGCTWVPGHWHHGVWHPAHKVCRY